MVVRGLISKYKSMPETIFSELLKQGTAIALLAVIGWTLWKRYDVRMRETVAELKVLRERFEMELIQDRVELKMLVKETNDMNARMIESVRAFSEFCKKENKTNQQAINRNANIMECLTREIKSFKQKQSA